MPAAIDGGLLSSDFLASGLVAAYGNLPALGDAAVRAYARDRAAAELSLGPASSARAVLQASVRALVRWLGWILDEPRPAAFGALHATLVAAGAEPVALLVLPWARDPAASERSAASTALEEGRRWAFLTNGRRLRIVDATRVPSAAVDCDLALCGSHPESLARLHLLGGPRSFRPHGAGTVLDHARALSDVAGVRVCRDLRDGVRSALATFGRAIETRVARRASDSATHDAEALTAVYRVLFLLFAEARGLVPSWHPIYRDGYTIAALASRLERRGDPRGTWAALQAIARLAHAGCSAGDLRVTAFNSRLFSPSAAPLLDHLALNDRAVGEALESLAFHAGPRGRQRISYADLGVEQLGSVYEQLLDDVPDRHAEAVSARKTSGSFYTPLALTDYLVRVTLGPLVEGRDAAAILSLRVLDPAMGSGAFLVSACRFLASAVERAMIVEGTLGEHEIAEPDRAHLRRLVAQRCLFGVDANPMAVQLAELSLWLATLAAEHPISFLEHHLRRGDSLIGARPADVMRQSPGGRRAGGPPLPLDPLLDSQEALAALLPARAELEQQPDTSAEIVREKERALTTLQRHPALVRWRAACDVWCAFAMTDAAPPGRYAMLIDHAFGRAPALPRDRVAAEFDRVTSEARAAGAFHWPLEFPEVFLDRQGRPRPDAGFDAVLGNPPWEMLRADPGAGAARIALGRFARSSGLYVAQSRGHTNAYQLFLERVLTLLRPGGRLGLLVPSGLLTDSGSGPLRRVLVERHRFESAAVFENRRAIFPIHRGLRFAAITAVHSGTTGAVHCRFGLDSAQQSAALDPARGEGFTLSLTPALLRTLGTADLAFPDLPTPADAVLVERLVSRHPPLAAPGGWAVTFGRELNATDDRDCLSASRDPSSLVVLDGRDLEAFRVRLDRAGRRADRTKVIARLGARARDIDRPRLAYREVAAATNRTTLIAAVVPVGAVTVHTIFCCRARLADVDAAALCALLNSYVANYLVRRWVTTHVTATVMSRLPVPLPDGRIRRLLAQFARGLARAPSASVEAECQARSAEAYGLNLDEFAHVLDTFPLVERASRDAALAAFRRGAP
jgi:N-6 DNA Methylase